MNNFKIAIAVLFSGAAGGAGAQAAGEQLTTFDRSSCLTSDASNPRHDGRKDFDFLVGQKWRIDSRKRVGRFINSTKWDEPVGQEFDVKIGDAGVLINVEYPAYRPGYKLTVFHLYNPLTRKWGIYDAHKPTDIQTPLIGNFNLGVGVFVADDVLDGVPVKVRFTWVCDLEHPRFTQDWSNDGGKTWEVDWTMTYTKVK